MWSRRGCWPCTRRCIRLRGKSPFDEKWFDAPVAGRPDHDPHRRRATTCGPAREALLAHATQVDPNEPFWFGLTDDELAEVYPWEDWVLAESLVGFPPPGELEDDLFAGVRERVS